MVPATRGAGSATSPSNVATGQRRRRLGREDATTQLRPQPGGDDHRHEDDADHDGLGEREDQRAEWSHCECQGDGQRDWRGVDGAVLRRHDEEGVEGAQPRKLATKVLRWSDLSVRSMSQACITSDPFYSHSCRYGQAKRETATWMKRRWPLLAFYDIMAAFDV
jgi:hypothetical protein